MVTKASVRKDGVKKISAKKVGAKKVAELEEDYSLNDVLLRGRVSQPAV